MKIRPKIYVETSVISYLTSRTATLEHLKQKQEITRTWWEQREDYDLFISSTVFDEIDIGDQFASELRVAAAKYLPVLAATPEVKRLSEILLDKKAVPHKASQDAVHIAYASLYEMDYLLTWNQKHILNRQQLIKIGHILYQEGLKFPYICTPQYLLELDDEYVKDFDTGID
jgi:predicted nucleic acid-binding protein